MRITRMPCVPGAHSRGLFGDTSAALRRIRKPVYTRPRFQPLQKRGDIGYLPMFVRTCVSLARLYCISRDAAPNWILYSPRRNVPALPLIYISVPLTSYQLLTRDARRVTRNLSDFLSFFLSLSLRFGHCYL